MGTHGGSRAGGSGGGGGTTYSEADRAMQAKTGGVVLRADFDISSVDGNEKRAIYVDETGIAHVERIGSGERFVTNAAYVDGDFVNIDKSKMTALVGNTYPIREAARANGMEWSASNEAWLSKDHPLMRKIDYPESELRKMSDAKINKLAEAAIWQDMTRPSSSMRYTTLQEKARKVKTYGSRIQSASREQKIGVIRRAVDLIANDK